MSAGTISKNGVLRLDLAGELATVMRSALEGKRPDVERLHVALAIGQRTLDGMSTEQWLELVRLCEVTDTSGRSFQRLQELIGAAVVQFVTESLNERARRALAGEDR